MIRHLIVLGLCSMPAAAAPCPGNPDALGTERVLAVSAAMTPRVGLKQFPTSLALGRRAAQSAFPHRVDRPAAGCAAHDDLDP